MKVSIKKISGVWDLGYALDKHIISSTFTGNNEQGHPTFDTIRTEAGEALYQLKYKNDENKIKPLAVALAEYIYPQFENVGLLIPMPASTARRIQPVTEVTRALGGLVEKPVFDDFLFKKSGGQKLKDIVGKQEKLEALKGKFTVNGVIEGNGQRNALLIDDLYDTGATLEVACTALRTYPKLAKIYVATLTWK